MRSPIPHQSEPTDVGLPSVKARAGSWHVAQATGIHGRVGQRNAPTVLNALYNKTQFWDGRVDTLEQQAALPITNPFEMGSASIGDAVGKIASDKYYQNQFMQAFGHGVNEEDMLRAIATYERSLISFDSPFDHFIAGDKNAINDSAKRGWELFNTKARCNLCHALTDKQTTLRAPLRANAMAKRSRSASALRRFRGLHAGLRVR